VIALCPALFEELAFRGVIHGRFLALLGKSQGMLATGVCFGLCHGVTAGLPFHVGLGIYFSWLRERSSSLFPGMLTHALYNGALVLAA
jgi:membrane protease YdiL (CAAX protease family)